MEHSDENLGIQKSKNEYIPEKYHWKRSYTLVLAANAIYIVFFYVLMKIFA